MSVSQTEMSQTYTQTHTDIKNHAHNPMRHVRNRILYNREFKIFKTKFGFEKNYSSKHILVTFWVASKDALETVERNSHHHAH